MKKAILFILFLIMIAGSLTAQYVPGVHWKKIETEHFLIIFPEEISEQAKIVAGKIDLIYQMDALAFGEVRQSRWPVILTTSGTEANGYVAMGPRKSVWYGTPMAENISTLNWYDLLALHETRHMVQNDRLNSRLNHLLYILMGQNGLNIGINFGVPAWFFEGDAVAAETAFSETGRGRDPLFYQGMREVVTNENYSYQKMVNGSFKDNLPNHYEYGYFLTSYIKKVYGEDSWNRILDSATLFPFPSFGMYLGAKKISGKSWSALYRDMTEDLKTQWAEQLGKVDLIDNTFITDRNSKIAEAYEPLLIEEGRILARKTSLVNPAVLVEITEDGEKKLMRVPSYGSIHARGNSVVWAYTRPSLLYGSRNWSDIVTVDLLTGKKSYITRKNRYLMPVYNHGADSIAVIEWTKERKANLVLIQSETGDVFRSYEVPEGMFPANPSWSEDDRSIYFTVQGDEGRAIARIDLDSGEFLIEKDFSLENIKNVNSWGKFILYASDKSGLENIMAMDRSNGEIYQVSSRVNGVRKPTIGIYNGEETLLYSEYSGGNGMQLALQRLETDAWIPEENMNILSFTYYGDEGHVEGPEGFNLDKVNSEAVMYDDDDVLDYSLAGSKANIHSWGLSTGEDSFTSLAVSINSSDIMGTMDWSLGGEYNFNEKSVGAFTNLNWRQFYPVISWSNRYRFREIDYVDTHDLKTSLTLSMPLNLSRDIWSHTLTPIVGAGFQALIGAGETKTRDYGLPVNYGLKWISVLPGSYRSIKPLLGIEANLSFEHNPLNMENHFFSSQSTIYLPGGFRNTSLSFNGAYENQSGNYSSKVLFSRGYDAETMDQLIQVGGNYSFPIAYPDLALGSFLYIKRFKGNLFYDQTIVYDDFSNRTSSQSVGAELSMDFTAFNFTNLPLNLGVRFAWLIEEEKPLVQIMLMNFGI